MRCSSCQSERDAGDRLPMGWKRLGDAVHCDKCWRERYALRAVTLPIVSPIGMDWQELRKMLRESFQMATHAANWALRQLAAHDAGIGVGAKLGRMDTPEPGGKSLYKGVADQFALDTRTASVLVQAASAKYRASRLGMHRGEVSLPSIRYPHPIPVHNNTWSVREGEDGGLELNFPLGRKQRVSVRLKGGVNYRRQLVQVRQIIRGEAVQGQLDIMEQGTKVLAKMVGWFPKADRTAKPWAASLATGGDAFLTLYNDERRTIYRWNADHVRRWIAAQDEQMQRLREDLKAEKRLGRERDGILARMDLLSRQNHDRMHSFCHEVSAQVIRHLERRRCGTLICAMQDQSYMPHFPWHKLKSMLADKANRTGIEIASGDAASESPEPLETETQQ